MPFLPFVYLLVYRLVSFVFACTCMKWGYLKQGCELLGASKKGKDASPQMAMFSRLGGLAPLERSSLPLSLSLFSRACIRVPHHVLPFIFLLLAWATFPRYSNVCFTFLVPCWAVPLEHWQCLIYFPTLCGCIVHIVCISIFACLWVIMYFVWWTLMATWVTLSSHEKNWPCSVGIR